MKLTKKTKTIPIRMDDSTADRLNTAAVKLSSSRAAVIRLAIFQFLPDIEAGQITLRGRK